MESWRPSPASKAKFKSRQSQVLAPTAGVAGLLPFHLTLSAQGLQLISADKARSRSSTHSCQDIRHTQAQGGNQRPKPLLRTAWEVWKGWGHPETPKCSLQWGPLF